MENTENKMTASVSSEMNECVISGVGLVLIYPRNEGDQSVSEDLYFGPKSPIEDE
jgi:hypothetical protein